MITAIKKRMQVRGEGGFTLIELLVVIIIIAILAAIAIPMYLSQRQKGWDANVQSDLRNAAVAEESWYTDNSATGYTNVVANLTAQGYHMSANVTLTVPSASGGANAAYCLEAFHASNPTRVWHMASGVGDPVVGPCT
ncbi:MAG: prepilin-type N-terminal cleavage/methylation domain-containing protein [Thermoleophilia bacterium]